MRLVVVDPELLVAGFLVPSGWARKLLVVLAYGRLEAYERLFDPAERSKLQADANAFGGVIAGRPHDDVLTEARERKALMADRLPVLTPDEWGLAASFPIYNEVEHLVQEVREDLSSLPPDAPQLIRRQLVAHTARVVEEEDGLFPRYTDGRARDKDYLIETAITAQAEFLITNDARVASSVNSAEPYRNETKGAHTKAVRLNYFVEEHLYGYHFELDDVDGSVLALAMRGLTRQT